MARPKTEGLEKVTFNIFSEDHETLARFHPHIGWSVAARQAIHRYCEALREKDRQTESASDVDLGKNIEVPDRAEGKGDGSTENTPR